MSSINREADVLAALKMACDLENKYDIVIKVIECIRDEFNRFNPDNNTSDVIIKEKFVQEMNMYINELKKIQ